MGNPWYSETAVVIVMIAITAFLLVGGVQTVIWPGRRETAITTAMVFVMVAITSVFFLIADQIMRLVVTFLLGIGG
jgi:preprotein translocase subunit SecE